MSAPSSSDQPRPSAQLVLTTGWFELQQLLYRHVQPSNVQLGKRFKSLQQTGAPAFAQHLRRSQAALPQCACTMQLASCICLVHCTASAGLVCAGSQPDTAGDGVEVSFEDGSTVRSKLVLGADGYHSRVREHCLGDGPPDFAVRACACTSKGSVQQLQRVVLGRGALSPKAFPNLQPIHRGRPALASVLARAACTWFTPPSRIVQETVFWRARVPAQDWMAAKDRSYM